MTQLDSINTPTCRLADLPTWVWLAKELAQLDAAPPQRERSRNLGPLAFHGGWARAASTDEAKVRGTTWVDIVRIDQVVNEVIPEQKGGVSPCESV